MQTIYLDYNATTPLDPAVREAMLPYLGDVWGNPSSIHQVGRRARAILDEARDRVARVLRSKPSEVVFTSGGTEANNLAIFGAARLLKEKGRHIITSAIEHHAVLHVLQYLERREGFTVTRLGVDKEGHLAPEAVRNAIQPDTVLVTLMAANNEIGTIQPVAEIGRLCHEHGILFHTDAVQWFGKEPFSHIDQFNADLVSMCAHKFHGPKGAGALYIRSPLQPDPILFGGGHENERRAGTENLPAIIGFSEAFERFVPAPVFRAPHVPALASRLEKCIDRLSGSGVVLRGSRSARLANTVAMTVAGVDAMTLLAALDIEGICASSGSACSAGSLEPSHVLLALGVGPVLSNSLIRFSLGRETSEADINRVEDLLPRLIARAQGSE